MAAWDVDVAWPEFELIGLPSQLRRSILASAIARAQYIGAAGPTATARPPAAASRAPQQPSSRLPITTVQYQRSNDPPAPQQLHRPPAATRRPPAASLAMEPFAKRPRVEGPGAAAIRAEEAITFHL